MVSFCIASASTKEINIGWRRNKLTFLAGTDILLLNCTHAHPCPHIHDLCPPISQPCPPMNNNIAPMPTQNPWAWALMGVGVGVGAQCRSLVSWLSGSTLHLPLHNLGLLCELHKVFILQMFFMAILPCAIWFLTSPLQLCVLELGGNRRTFICTRGWMTDIAPHHLCCCDINAQFACARR